MAWRGGQRVVAVGQRGHVLSRRRRQALAAGRGARQLRPRRGALPHADRRLGSRPRRRGAAQTDGAALGAPLDGRSRCCGRTELAPRDGRAKRDGASPTQPTNPLLDVWFEDAKPGYVVGAFGLMLRTRDGGTTGSRCCTRDNPKTLHLYAVRGIGGDLYIAGEQGLLLKLDRASGASAPRGCPTRARCSA